MRLTRLNEFRLQEEFVKKLAEVGYSQTLSENRQHIQYRDMGSYVLGVQHILQLT